MDFVEDLLPIFTVDSVIVVAGIVYVMDSF